MTKYRKGPQKTTKEAAGNWHQLKSMVPYIPMHAKILQNSLIHSSVYFAPAWYSLLTDLHCHNF